MALGRSSSFGVSKNALKRKPKETKGSLFQPWNLKWLISTILNDFAGSQSFSYLSLAWLRTVLENQWNIMKLSKNTMINCRLRLPQGAQAVDLTWARAQVSTLTDPKSFKMWRKPKSFQFQSKEFHFRYHSFPPETVTPGGEKAMEGIPNSAPRITWIQNSELSKFPKKNRRKKPEPKRFAMPPPRECLSPKSCPLIGPRTISLPQSKFEANKELF